MNGGGEGLKRLFRRDESTWWRGMWSGGEEGLKWVLGRGGSGGGA